MAAISRVRRMMAMPRFMRWRNPPEAPRGDLNPTVTPVPGGRVALETWGPGGILAHVVLEPMQVDRLIERLKAATDTAPVPPERSS